ncbi:uncharacterized protein LOC125524051 isoform X2 [Triticum urartu]|uniref:uncharacterized protein LOC125524051 isoform X2 n=1 Tax=Triticum urartu TaxID=4572 RepID=UPI0020432445|nr:uncharacterized protein LOC125524051 isoform X2 [Triticum urartu]
MFAHSASMDARDGGLDRRSLSRGARPRSGLSRGRGEAATPASSQCVQQAEGAARAAVKTTVTASGDHGRGEPILDSDVSAFLPSKGNGKFLKKFVGHVNVWAARKEDKIKVKDEYNNYRDRSAYMFLLFPSTLLLLRWWVWDGCLPALTVQVYQAWLLFLYTSFALEENVLLVNGRDIRPWCTLKMQSCYMLEPSRASKFSQTIKGLLANTHVPGTMFYERIFLGLYYRT